MKPNIRRGDSFFAAYISEPFQAHIAKFRKENTFHLGTLHRRNSGMPIWLGATKPPMLLAPPTSTEVSVIDVPMLPMADEDNQVVQMTAVTANQMMIAQ